MINRPGIEVQFASNTSVPRDTASPGTYFSVGYAEWGPVNKAVFISDKVELQRVYGAVVGYGKLVFDGIHFFDTANGVGRGYFVRGFKLPAETTLDDCTASVVLQDSGGDPALTVTAAHPGTLGNNLKVDVINDTNGYKTIYLWGRGTPRKITWYFRSGATGTEAAEYMARNEAQIAVLNGDADLNASDFRITIAENVNAAGPALTDTQSKQLFSPSGNSTSLVGGSDGDTSRDLTTLIGSIDGSGIATGSYVLDDPELGVGTVGIPGWSPTLSMTTELDLHAKRNNRLAVVSLIPSGASALNAQGALALANTLKKSDFVSYYFPEVYDLTGALSPCEGYVAGLIARNQARIDNEGGIKASATGDIPVTGVRQYAQRDPVKDAEAELLYVNNINYIKFVRGIGFRVDSQLLSRAQGAISRVHHRNIINTFKYEIEELLAGFRDRTIDSTGDLQGEIKSALETYLEPYGPGQPSPKGNTLYNVAVVVTDNSIQNEADLNQGLLHVQVSASLSPKAERISLLFEITPARIEQ